MATVVLLAPLGNTGFGTFGFHLSRELLPLVDRDGVTFRILSGNDRRRAVAADSPDAKARAVHAAHARIFPGIADVSVSMFDATNVVVLPGRVRVGFTMWEGSQVPPEFAEQLRPFDLVAVPSHWNQRALDAALAALPPGPRPATTVWPGAAPDIAFANAGPSRYRGDAFTFGNVGKFERRKGIVPMVMAYAEVARARRGTPMRLLANWTHIWHKSWAERAQAMLGDHGFEPEPGDRGGALARFRHRDARNATIELLLRPLPGEDDVIEFHRGCDAGLYPYFCEGWGLPLIETLACGVPCAANPYSAPTEYLLDGGYVPIAGTVERPMRGVFYQKWPWGTWREPTLEAIVAAMATLLDMPPERRLAMGARARDHLQQRFTWRDAAVRVAADLNAILAAMR